MGATMTAGQQQPAAPWYACPACGNRERGRGNPRAVTGEGRASLFADGHDGYAVQGRVWTLACPCGRTWQVEERSVRARYGERWVSTYAPYAPPPPPTPEEARLIALGAGYRDRRVAAAVSLRAAAEHLGIEPAALSAIERGKAGEPDPDLLARLEVFLVGREAIPDAERTVLL
jgi:hypothetical protein